MFIVGDLKLLRRDEGVDRAANNQVCRFSPVSQIIHRRNAEMIIQFCLSLVIQLFTTHRPQMRMLVLCINVVSKSW
ncbi:hypothetical protein MPTK1_3g05460 [Marchantia polymorpha subsp. ruderalis]|uniref:Uncharacterized protein n=2 Tax=Marchantia polymorpha TaxID=3197 RepID=A0AAF6AXP7_MARPO|nr:hypothetical protein MARPO_0006s0019 [Marchantia polymorpha]BBN04531.1 hypothetical protein Mp_3g05460 [Marchantia polymorpha subsp. ruderalis]|eukprot:PTQ47968.1 hypothetical protein MARPO_0006s0019 [Marchantia polymorpha]